MSDEGLQRTGSLLQTVFPHATVGNPEYLRWLYVESPFGNVIETNIDDDEGRAAHYALIPLGLRVNGEPRHGALSLNTAVHERARGGGAFTRLAAETIEKASNRGITTVIGVANANSTPGFLRRLEFELVLPLPATVLVPLPVARRLQWQSNAASEVPAAELGADQRLFTAPERGLAVDWTPEALAWRLRRPGARYAVHRREGAVAVSAADHSHGVPVAVILKVFAADALSNGAWRGLVYAAARWHKAPAALHVGVSDRISPRGVPLPKRFRSSPLNLIRRDLGPDPSGPVTRLEFLDFDAY